MSFHSKGTFNLIEVHSIRNLIATVNRSIRTIVMHVIHWYVLCIVILCNKLNGAIQCHNKNKRDLLEHLFYTNNFPKLTNVLLDSKINLIQLYYVKHVENSTNYTMFPKNVETFNTIF